MRMNWVLRLTSHHAIDINSAPDEIKKSRVDIPNESKKEKEFDENKESTKKSSLKIKKWPERWPEKRRKPREKLKNDKNM